MLEIRCCDRIWGFRHVISYVDEGGAVQATGLAAVGDVIIGVNNQSLEGATHDDVLDHLRNAGTHTLHVIHPDHHHTLEFDPDPDHHPEDTPYVPAQVGGFGALIHKSAVSMSVHKEGHIDPTIVDPTIVFTRHTDLPETAPAESSAPQVDGTPPVPVADAEPAAVGGGSVVPVRTLGSLIREKAADIHLSTKHSNRDHLGFRTLSIEHPAGTPFGVSFTAQQGLPGVYVEEMVPGGVWASSGDTMIHDVVLKINGHSALNLDIDGVIAALQASGTSFKVNVGLKSAMTEDDAERNTAEHGYGGMEHQLNLHASTAHIFGEPDPAKEDAQKTKRREEEELTEVRTLRITPGDILGATFAAMPGRDGIRVEGLTPGGAWASSGDARIDDVVLKVNGKSVLKLSRSGLLGELYKQSSPYNVSVISARGLGWEGDGDASMAELAFAASMGIVPVEIPIDTAEGTIDQLFNAAATPAMPTTESAATPVMSMAEAAAARELEEDEFEALVAQQGLAGALGFADAEPSLERVEVVEEKAAPLRTVQSSGTSEPPPEPPRDYAPRTTADAVVTAAPSSAADADTETDHDHLGDNRQPVIRLAVEHQDDFYVDVPGAGGEDTFAVDVPPTLAHLEAKLMHIELDRTPGQKLGLHVTSASSGVGGRIAHVDAGSVCHAAGITQGVVLAQVNGENMLDKDHDHIMQSLVSAISTPGKIRLATVDAVHLDEVPVSDEALNTATERVSELQAAGEDGGGIVFRTYGTATGATIDDEPAWDPLGDVNATPIMDAEEHLGKLAIMDAENHLGKLETKLDHTNLVVPTGQKLGLRLSSQVNGTGARISHVRSGSVAHHAGSIKVGSVIAKVNGENMLNKNHQYILSAIASIPGKVKISTIDADLLDEVPVLDHHLDLDDGVAIASPFKNDARPSADVVSKLQFEGLTPKKQTLRRKDDGTFGLALFSSKELTGARVTHSALEGEAQIDAGEVVVEVNGMGVIHTPHDDILRRISASAADLEIVTLPAHEIEKVDTLNSQSPISGSDGYVDFNLAAVPDYDTIGGFPLLYRNELENIMGQMIAKVRALAPTEWSDMTYPERIEVLHTVCVEHFRPVVGDVHHETEIIAAHGGLPDNLRLPDDLTPVQLKEIEDALVTLPGDLSAKQIKEIRDAQASGMSRVDVEMLIMEKTEEASLARRKLRKAPSTLPTAINTRSRELSNASTASSEDDFGSGDGADLLGSSAPAVTSPPPNAALVLAESLKAADAVTEETQFSGVHASQDPDNFLDYEADTEHTLQPWRKAVLDKRDEKEEEDLAILIENTSGTAQRKYKRQLKHHLDKHGDESVLDHLDERFSSMQADLNAAPDDHRNVVLQTTPGVKYGMRLVGDANHRGARVQSLDPNGLASASGQIAVGDRILAIDDTPTSQMALAAIVEKLATKLAAKAVKLELRLDDAPMPIELSVEEIADAADPSGKIITVSISKPAESSKPVAPLGIRLYHSPSDLGARIQYVDPESEVGQSGILREHDCIVGINGQTVSELGYDEVADMLEHPETHLEIKVLRQHAPEHPSVTTVHLDTAGSFGISTEDRTGLFLDGVGATGVQGGEDGDRILAINGTCVLGLSPDAAGVILKLAEGAVELETVARAAEGSSDFWDVLTKNATLTTVHPGASLGMRLYNDHLDVVQARVLEVSPLGAAVAAGIPAGAVILAVNGKSVIQRPFHDISGMLTTLAGTSRDSFDLTFGMPSNASHERVPLQRHVKVENHGDDGLGFELSAPDANGTVRIQNLTAFLRAKGLLREGDAVLSINGAHVEGSTAVGELIKGARTVDLAVLAAGIDVWSNVNSLDAPVLAPALSPSIPTQLPRLTDPDVGSHGEDETAMPKKKKVPPKVAPRKTGLPRVASTGAGGNRRAGSTPKARNGGSNIARPTHSPQGPSSPAPRGEGGSSSLSRGRAQSFRVPEVLKHLGFQCEEVPVTISRNVDGSIGVQIYSDDGVDGCLVGSLTDRLSEMGLRVRDHIVSVDGITVESADVPEVLSVFGNAGTAIALVVNRVKSKDLSSPTSIRRAIAAAKAKPRTPSSLRSSQAGILSGMG